MRLRFGISGGSEMAAMRQPPTLVRQGGVYRLVLECESVQSLRFFSKLVRRVVLVGRRMAGVVIGADTQATGFHHDG